jgi:hypothetical protein
LGRCLARDRRPKISLLTSCEQHTLLQRLPSLPQLRSLNLPNIANHVIGAPEAKELALQIVDIITLRPEIQLCYVGISNKCFEILEARSKEGLSSGSETSLLLSHVSGSNDSSADDDDGGSDGDTTDDDETDDDDTPTSVADPDDTASEAASEAASDSQDSDDDPSSFADRVHARTRLRLREILFYDDKVAIFKARHGKL